MSFLFVAVCGGAGELCVEGEVVRASLALKAGSVFVGFKKIRGMTCRRVKVIVNMIESLTALCAYQELWCMVRFSQAPNFANLRTFLFLQQPENPK